MKTALVGLFVLGFAATVLAIDKVELDYRIRTLTAKFEQKGLRLAGLKLVQASRELAEKHYAVHKGKPFYESLLQFLTAGPTVAMVWEGREAINVARTLIRAAGISLALPALECLRAGAEESSTSARSRSSMSTWRDMPWSQAARMAGWLS